MQRQLRLGDILDDYCPRERRVTNHAVVAMLGEEVKQTRCTTCDAEHEYKQAKVPRQRRKSETPAALYAAVLSGGPKVVTHNQEAAKNGAVENDAIQDAPVSHEVVAVQENVERHASDEVPDDVRDPDEQDLVDGDVDRSDEEEGPVHRPLIRASLPRTEGQPPPQRQAPDFTIRQPGGGRPSRFRPRHQRGAAPFHSNGNRSNGNVAGGPPRGGMPRHGGGHPPQGAVPRVSRRHGQGRKRSK